MKRELAEDAPLYRAMLAGLKEAFGEFIRQIPLVGPLIMGTMAASESLLGDVPDPTARALIARHEELLGQKLQLEAEVADLRRALAEQSDESAARALQELDTGDTQAAEDLFKGLLDRKRAEGIAANREASAAARHLATLALLHGRGGMARALDYSEEAVGLAPDDIAAWLLRGLVLWSAGLAGPARDAYRQALDLDPEERDRAIALAGVGDASVLLGALAEALDCFDKAKALFEHRSGDAPDDVERQRDLSVSLDRIGDVQVARGQLDALKAFNQSLDIRKRLAAADPTNSGWQRDLSVSLNKIGDVQVARGQLDDALKAFNQSLDIAQRLAAADPSNAEWWRDLIVSEVKLAEVAEATGDAYKAMRRYGAALKMADELARSGRLAPRDAWVPDYLEKRLESLRAR